MRNKTIQFIACILFLAPLTYSQPIGKLTVAKAGTITPPKGKIAFIRDGNIWTTSVESVFPKILSEVTNADGRLTWAPDGKKVVFTRSGIATMTDPTLGGGKHKLYDIFVAFLDSANLPANKNWMRLTDDMGNRDPEWQAGTNKILFWKDMNANKVNTDYPNYQICTMSPDGSDIELLRKDWQDASETFITNPSMNSAGELAAVLFFAMKPQGIVVLKPSQFMANLDSLKPTAMKNQNLIAPAWSTDGKWIAYVSNTVADAGLYIMTPDFKERYIVFSPPVSTYMYTHAPSFSPDSKWLTFATTDGSVWVCDITGSGARRITPPGQDRAPVWSK